MSTQPGIGRDEWVARSDERTQRKGFFGPGADMFMRLPWWVRWGLFVAFVAVIPLVTTDGYVRRVCFDTLLYVLLALGLNVVVGWGGLLDLGYVAFYGFGAYLYAWLDSNQFHVHLPSLVAIPLVVAATAFLGFLVGLPSRRLSGDYLAIVTLFFLQAFLTIMINGSSIFGVNLTNGANGIAQVDPLNIFGHHLPVAHLGVFNVWYLYVALAFFVVVLVALRFVNDSRTGRAWRALREDPLAAELMSMPVNKLKLMAFAFGAATAGLTGDALRLAQRGRLPGELRVAAPDHDLRDGDPRRGGEPGRRRARRDARQRDARGAALAAALALGVLRGSAGGADRLPAPVEVARDRAARHARLRRRGARDRPRDPSRRGRPERRRAPTRSAG